MSEERLAAIEKDLAELRLKVSQLRRGLAAAIGLQPTLGTRVATAAELDGPDGDPKITKDPPKWTGTFRGGGRHYSETTPEYLAAMAKFQDWCAERELADPARRKYAKLSAQRAALARGWAARLKERGTAPQTAKTQIRNPYEQETNRDEQEESSGESPDDIPF